MLEIEAQGQGGDKGPGEDGGVATVWRNPDGSITITQTGGYTPGMPGTFG